MANKWVHDQSPQKNVAGLEDQTCDRPHARRTGIWQSYQAQQNINSETLMNYNYLMLFIR